MILEVDEEKRRISLGVKQLTENPWQVFTHKHKEGDKIKGTIKSITDFGVFIGLEGNIDGLVHLSDVSWNDEEEAIRQLEKNQEIEAIVLSIDVERERISLGIKQLQEDAFNEYTQLNNKGSRVKGKVNEITDERIILLLSEGVQGYIPLKDYQNSSQEGDPSLGDDIEVVVASIDKKDREIILSLRALEKAEERDALKDNVDRNKEIEEASKSNIGDMIKAELQDNEDE
jgi:small subunit ribosomal protein S1